MTTKSHSGLAVPGTSDAGRKRSFLSEVVRHFGLRQRRFKLVWVLIASIGFVLLVAWGSPHSYEYNKSIALAYAYLNRPSQPRTELIGSKAAPPLSSQARLTLNEDGSIPDGLGKPNPSFHLLMRTSDYSPNVGMCRTAFSAMVLNYPPPTLIPYMKSSGDPSSHITEIDEYLSDENSKHFKDDDIVLVVDEGDTWFQLPAELMVQRFQLLLQKSNSRLWRKYGATWATDGTHKRYTQKYHERIIFSADKTCGFPQNDTACTVVPYSDLPPDVYGTSTDKAPDPALNRPRWLNSGAAMGTLADMRLLYEQAAKIWSTNTSLTEPEVLGQIHGDQEYARELERQVTSTWVTHLAESMGILTRMDLSNIKGKLKPYARYDYSVGIDYKSQLFGNLLYSEEDIEWMHYDDIDTVSTVQLRLGVPRESRLTLPSDIAGLESPFMPLRQKASNMAPHYNKTLDQLPHAWNSSWPNLPLATNVRSKSVPALLHMNSTDADTWSRMWYHPWGRALLRKYMRASHSPTIVASSMLGGADLWDTRGGKGGIWTLDRQWSGWAAACRGFEAEVFGDKLGIWGEEGGTS